MFPDSASGGGSFPTLPAGTPGYAIALVAVAVIVVSLVGFASKFIRPRDAPAAKPETTQTAARPADTDYQMTRETIDRLERQLEKAEAEQDAIRKAYDQQVERNHALELQLAARDTSLAAAREEVAVLRATVEAMRGPVRREPPPWSPPPPPVRRPPYLADVVDPDATTDPLPRSSR